MPNNNMVAETKRRAAIKNLEAGAVTEGYTADAQAIIEMLQQAVATEVICVLRYRRHYYMAKGVDSEPVAQEFLEHSNEELSHVDRLSIRITQLGGQPNLRPDDFSKISHTEYIEANNLKDMIRENLIAERVVIDSYRAMIEKIGSSDPTTRRLLEDILAVEEEHADELSDLL